MNRKRRDRVRQDGSDRRSTSGGLGRRLFSNICSEGALRTLMRSRGLASAMSPTESAVPLPAAGGGGGDEPPTPPPPPPGKRTPGKKWSIDDEDLLRVLTCFVSRLCPSWFSSEQRREVFQETCLRLVAHTKNGRGPFRSSYLWQTTTHVRNEMARKFGSRKRHECSLDSFRNVDEEEPVPFDPPSGELDPERITRGSEVGNQIRAGLNRLPAMQCRAVLLHLFGYSYREIAHHLDCNVKKAENNVCRGMKKLRQILRRKRR